MRSLTQDLVTLACPGCGAPMQRETLARHPTGTAVIDACEACHAFWFDAYESPALTGPSAIALFRRIADARPVARRALPARMGCPRCRTTLAETHDVARHGRLRYWRCPGGHGRFTPFVQFLLEKGFVRPLPAHERARIAATIGMVRCSGCGAPVDLAADLACSYCRAPVMVLDGDAMRRALEAASRAPAPLAAGDVDRLVDALRERRSATAIPPGVADIAVPIDLVASGLAALLDTVD